MKKGKSRLDFSRALRLLLRDIAARVPEFSHIEPNRVLITSGQARRRSRATTRPYAFATTGTRKSENGALYKPVVKIKGRRIRYEITLRPLFFMRSTRRSRLRTLFHELYHCSRAFDGTLEPSRRHDKLSQADFERVLFPIVRRYERVASEAVLKVLGHDGEVLVLQWLERPPSRYRAKSKVKRRYSEADLFLGPVMMKTLD
jgi:Putative phage metallopeptidase